LLVNFDYFDVLMFRKQNPHNCLVWVSRRPDLEKPMHSFGKFLVVTTISMLASGGAIAQTSKYEYGPTPSDPSHGWMAQGRPVQELEWLRYGYSGTRGRMGLGADPAHPEGPGNFSSPGR
jgi:hypothetical protein